MSRHVGFAGGLKASGVVTLDDLPDDARAARNDLDRWRHEKATIPVERHPVKIRATADAAADPPAWWTVR
jgi:uncharacterized protein (DUF3084 family)